MADVRRGVAAEERVSGGIAVFDLDGTLSRRDTFLPFLIGCLARQPARWLSLPRLAIAVGRYYAGAIDNVHLKTVFLTAIVGGATAEELRPWTTAFVARLIGNGLRRDALAALRDHRAAGRTTILATASPALYAAPLAAQLGFDVVIASRLARDGTGRFTGQLEDGNCHGTEKAARFSAWRAASAISGPLWVYTDHHADLPLLELADRRFAISPTRRLRDAAVRRDIALLTWS